MFEPPQRIRNTWESDKFNTIRETKGNGVKFGFRLLRGTTVESARQAWLFDRQETIGSLHFT